MDDLIGLLTLPFHAGMGRDWAVDRLVIDATDLHGTYDFDFENGRTGPADETDSGPATFATAFDAVKSLGLKLEPSKHTYDFIVVDHAERVPTEN